MEEWLAAGALSEEEFELLVRLTARYFIYDVDQFDHWKMPGIDGNFFYVDFSWNPGLPDDGESYRPMWPSLSSSDESGWVLWQVDAGGARREVARYATKGAADAYRLHAEHAAHRRGNGRSYVVTSPTPQLAE